MSTSTQTHALLVEQLLGATLGAVVRAQGLVASQLADLVESIGFVDGPAGQPMQARTFEFQFSRTVPAAPGSDTFTTQNVTVQMPLLSVVSLPTIAIDEATVDLDLRIVAFAAEEPGSRRPTMTETHKAVLGRFGPSAKAVGLFAVPTKPARPTSPAAQTQVAGTMRVSVTMRRVESPLGMEKIETMFAEAVRSEQTP